ncbi:MAG: hypothetical protein WC438_04545 [Candidatus Pacearchaeota archaeon]
MAEINTNHRTDHNLICPTAKLVAYARANSDIPYSREISDIVGAEQVSKELLGENFEFGNGFLAPYMEARFKAQSKYLHGKSILELAVGILPRGLIETSNPRITYVGTDLQEMIGETKSVMNKVINRNNLSRPNLHFETANALDYEQLKEASKYFNGGDFSASFEGLFVYLNRDEQRSLLSNLRKLVNPGHGFVVTPDISDLETSVKRRATWDEDFKQNVVKVLPKITNATQRNILDSFFPTQSEAEKFIGECGFSAQFYPLYDESYKLSTAQNIPVKYEKDTNNFVKSMKICVMTPK